MTDYDDLVPYTLSAKGCVEIALAVETIAYHNLNLLDSVIGDAKKVNQFTRILLKKALGIAGETNDMATKTDNDTRRSGSWIPNGGDKFVCSCCMTEVVIGSDERRPWYKFCPKCGAEIRQW